MRSIVLSTVLGILFGGLLGFVILVGNESAFAAQADQAEWGYESSGDFWYKLTGENPFDMFVVLEQDTVNEGSAKVEMFRITRAVPCAEEHKIQVITWVIGEGTGKKIACDESVSYIKISKNWERALRPFPEEVERSLRAQNIPEGSLRT